MYLKAYGISILYGILNIYGIFIHRFLNDEKSSNS